MILALCYPWHKSDGLVNLFAILPNP